MDGCLATLFLLFLAVQFISQHPWETLVALALACVMIAYARQGRRAEQQARRRQQESRLRAIRVSNVDQMTGVQFEQYVRHLLTNQGFTVTMTPASSDYGADLIAKRPGTGSKSAVQVKRRKSKVPGTAVSEVVAAKAYYGCDSAMVVTNSYFTKAAVRLAQANACRLVDRGTLTQWIVSFSQGEETFELGAKERQGRPGGALADWVTRRRAERGQKLRAHERKRTIERELARLEADQQAERAAEIDEKGLG